MDKCVIFLFVLYIINKLNLKFMKKESYIWVAVIVFLVVAFFASVFLPKNDLNNEPLILTEKVETSNNNRLYDEAMTDACLVEAYLYGIPKGENAFADMVNDFHKEKEDFLSVVKQPLEYNQMIALMIIHKKVGTRKFAKRIEVSSEEENIGSVLFSRKEMKDSDVQDFWILYHIYYSALYPLDLYDYPIQSYLMLPTDVMYDEDALPTWHAGFEETLMTGGDKSTLRDANFIPKY